MELEEELLAVGMIGEEELPPPEGDENLISIGNQMTIPESLRLLEKVKRGKKKFKDFYRNTDTEFYKPKFVRKETEEILF